MDVIFGHGYFKAFTIIFAALVVCFVASFKRRFLYWKRNNIPYLQPQIPWGTFEISITNPKSMADMIRRQHQQAKHAGHKFVGLFAFSRPILMLLDSSLIKQIMVTDFKHFMNRGVYFNENDDPLSAHLFTIEGVKWRNLRAKIIPTFTSGKLKLMFNIFKECGEQLKDAIQDIHRKSEPLDIKDVLMRFNTNIIMSAGFGIECNTFTDKKSDVIKYGKRIFNRSMSEALKMFIVHANPDLGRKLGICAIPNESSLFFFKLVKDTVDYREKNHVERNDFMKLLIDVRNGVQKGHAEQNGVKHLTIEELAAQAFIFFFAGFETSSTTMTFCLFELATNPDIQEKVRDEIKHSLRLHNGKLTYEAIRDMKYMGQAIDETLRKYPPLPILNRKCTEDYRIPDTDIVIQRGTTVIIPIAGLHNDPEYFPNPEKFDPERFSEKNKHNIAPCSYLPFGEGPRICIAVRLGILQTKVGLTVLLQNYKFSLNSKTKVPLKMDPTSFVQTTLGGIWLEVEKI